MSIVACFLQIKIDTLPSNCIFFYIFAVQKRILYKNKKQLRSHKVVVALNDDEKIFIDNYCNKNNIKSKGKFLRETAIRMILKQMHQYSPTLFD